MKKKVKEKMLLLFPAKIRDNILLSRSFWSPIKSMKIITNIRSMSCNSKTEGWGKLNADIDIWRKSFVRLSLSTKSGYEIATYFFKDNIKIIKLAQNRELFKSDVILISVVKNDIKKIKSFYTHYKNLGVKRFAILDNNSDDGTFEWLSSKEDIDLFQTDIHYTTFRRQAWINKIISYYGFENWYLIVDSDEHFVYEDMETKSLNDLVMHAKVNKIFRIRAIMIDMYSNRALNESTNDEDFLNEYIYFDSDNYVVRDHYGFSNVGGGMRVRMFKGDNPNFSPYLTKYPLIFFKPGDIQYNSHYSFPFYKNFNSPCWAGLLHYKFLSTDLKKYQDIVRTGSFSKGSHEYKQYMKTYRESPHKKFIHQDSKVYKNSNSLKVIDIMDEIEW